MQRYLRFTANQQGGSISSHPRASQASTAPRRTGSVPACQDGGRPVAPARPRASANHDARHVLNSNRREQDGGDNGGASVSRTYRPRRGSRYDSNEDRSISPEPRSPESSASTSVARTYLNGTVRPPTSPSTPRRRIPAFGSMTIALLVDPAGRRWMISSSETSPSTSQTWHRFGLNIFLRTRSIAERTCERSS